MKQLTDEMYLTVVEYAWTHDVHLDETSKVFRDTDNRDRYNQERGAWVTCRVWVSEREVRDYFKTPEEREAEFAASLAASKTAAEERRKYKPLPKLPRTPTTVDIDIDLVPEMESRNFVGDPHT